MLEALPGPQPIDFNTPPLLLCDCGDIPPTLIGEDDVLVFQVRRLPCDGDEVLFSNLSSLTPDAPGWTYTLDGALRVEPGNGTINGASTFVPVTGTTYRLVIGEVNIHEGGFTVTCGGVSFTVDTAGTHTFIFTAVNSAPLVLTTNDGSGFILYGLVVQDFSSALQVVITDSDGDHAAMEYGDHPSWFSFVDDRVTVSVPMADTDLSAGECFTVTISDTCEGGNSLTSQRLQVVAEICKVITVRTCLDDEAMGFVPFAPRLCVPAQVGRASWATESEEERSALGRYRTNYADRVLTLAVRTGAISYHDHNYLSSLPAWDHVYLYSDPARVLDVQPNSDGYEPAYDVSDSVAPVEFAVRLKQELVRNVACAAEGAGCAPADDPICNTADVQFSFSLDGNDLNITLVGITEFMPGDVTITVGEEAPFVASFDTENLPSTIAVHDLPPGNYDIGVVISNPSQPECFDHRIISRMFTCQGDGFGRIVVPTTGGNATIRPYTSTGFVSLYNSDTGITSTYAQGVYTSITAGTWCLFASDSGGGVTGGITNIIPLSGNVESYDFTDLAALVGTLRIESCPLLSTVGNYPPSATGVAVMNCSGVTALSALPAGVTALSLINLPVLAAVPTYPAGLTYVDLRSLPLITSLAAHPSTVTHIVVRSMPLTTLPAHPPGLIQATYTHLYSVTSIPAIPASCSFLHLEEITSLTIGTFAVGAKVNLKVKKVNTLNFTNHALYSGVSITLGWTNANSTSVDALINALDSTVPNSVCTIGATALAMRTAASDTNYNACVANGWVFS